MRHTNLTILLVAAVCVGFVHGQNAEEDRTKSLIISLEQRGWELVKKREVEAYDALLSNDYQDVGEFGVWDKQKSVQSIADTTTVLSSFSLNDFRYLRLSSTVVLLTYEAQQTGTSAGKPLPTPLFISSVWANRHGKWVNVLYQDTPAAANYVVSGDALQSEILSLEKRMQNASPDEVMQLESDDFEAIKHLHRYSREDDLSAAKDLKLTSWSMDDIRTRMLSPEVGLITYRVKLKGSFRGTEMPDSLYLSSIWVKRNNEWKNVFLAESVRDVFTDSYLPTSAPPNPTTSVASEPDSGTTEREIKQVEERLTDAILHSDTDTLKQIYAEDYIHTGTDGVLTNKEQRLAEFKNGLRKITLLKRGNVAIRTYGNTAIVTDVDNVRGQFEGHEFAAKARAVRVYVKQSGSWRLVTAQSTSMN